MHYVSNGGTITSGTADLLKVLGHYPYADGGSCPELVTSFVDALSYYCCFQLRPGEITFCPDAAPRPAGPFLGHRQTMLPLL